MRRFSQLSVLCVVAAVAAACDLDEVVQTEATPTAGLRFINAVPDTAAFDFRFVDIVENNAHWNIGFRDNPVTSACITGLTQVEYKATRAGERRFRIFLSDTLQAIASTVVKDTVVNIEANKRYSTILWGRSRAGSTPPVRLSFLEDNPPDPGSQIALRVMNTSSIAIEARHYPAGGSAPATAAWANIPPLSVSEYLLVAPGQIRVQIRPAGGTTILADAPALPGAAATVDTDALPGTTVAGSAVSAIFFDPPVAGSKAPQTAAFRTTTGSITQYATDTSIARTTGSFSTDCFFVGQQVTLSGFSAANNGVATITAMRAPPTTGSTTLSADPTGYSRSSGSFITNGFVVGQQITASGFTNAANNGRSTITGVTATQLTVTKSTPPVTEAAASGRTIIADAEIVVSRASPLVAQGAASGRTVLGERLLAFVWDRRPPRP